MKSHLFECADTDNHMQKHIQTRMKTCVLNSFIPVNLNNTIAAVFNPILIDVSLNKEYGDKTSMLKSFSKVNGHLRDI